MTERLYYTDPYQTDFEATVIRVGDRGGRQAVVLDRTAFYPASGGQPADSGTLGAARVVDVIDDEDGAILHVIEGDAPAGRVAGRIEWNRRFEHMQQHTGQHVLSAAFDRGCRVRTVSFHLGADASTIDLAREVTTAEIAQAEDSANQIVWEDRPVTIRFVDAADAAALPLRKETARTGLLRIIEVQDFDVSACGGTHVARTGAIGIVVVSSWERFKGGTRLEFKCGVRALRGYRGLRDVVSSSARQVSAAAHDLPDAIQRLQSELKESSRHARTIAERLATYEAEALAARAVDVERVRLVVEAVEDADVNGLKSMAQTIAGRAGHVAILLTASAPRSVVIARAVDVALDASALLKQMTLQFGGRGGGRPELAQGGGLDASPADVAAAATRALGPRSA